MNFGDITISNATDWMAADQLFRSEIQLIDAEVQDLREQKFKTSDLETRNSIQEKIDALSGIAGSYNEDGKQITADGARVKIINNYIEYQNKRREKLQN